MRKKERRKAGRRGSHVSEHLGHASTKKLTSRVDTPLLYSPQTYELYLMGGVRSDNYKGIYLNDVWKSPDGIHWTQMNDYLKFSPKRDMAAIAY